MKKQSLNGVWNYRVGQGKWTDRQVPFSALAVGHSECMRTFDLECKSDVVLLQFDGITYQADVFLNGHHLGVMYPYAEYKYDITYIVKEQDNQLLVLLEDMTPAFGPTEGWENYGGIIRDVSIYYASSSYIEDVFFKSVLENDFQDAAYDVQITLAGEKSGTCHVMLKRDQATVDEYWFDPSEHEETRKLTGVDLWSPDHPALYELEVELWDRDTLLDQYACRVGFRSFAMDRHRFLLNGKPLFVRGVCRHEMFGDTGHTVDDERIENDLRMIKETGCNFVRLVHYPHKKTTLDIADRLGLMVSEEPGLWQTDTSDPQVRLASLEVLRRTLIRDRNHPSIVFWLSFNECDFSEQFLKDAVNMCRDWDGTRLVSGANNMSNEDTLKYYNLCGLDFYTMHPYSDTFEMARNAARVLNDKPLMFTEWGGYYVYDNPHLLSDFLGEMRQLYLNNDDSGALAGTCLWYWAEINDFDRGGAACTDGVLKEALVDVHRKPTLIYHAFCESLKKMEEENMPEDLYEYIALDAENLGVSLQAKQSCIDRLELLNICRHIPNNRLCKSRKYQFTVGPVLQRAEIPGMYAVPQLLKDGDTLVFDADMKAEIITLLGAVSIRKGYPVSGEYGEEAAEVVVHYEHGQNVVYPLRNGKEITTVMTCLGSSRIDPICENAAAFARFSYDKNFENYLINRLDLQTDAECKINRIEIKSQNRGYDLLIYGVYAR